MKREVCLLLGLILLASFVAAQEVKLEVSTIKQSYQPDENITLKVSLFDASNNPLNGQIQVTFEDAEKTKSVNAQVVANEIASVYLGEQLTPGYWSATAHYETTEAQALFLIEAKQLSRFDLEGDTLTITNIGNDVYTKKVQIIIGDTVGVKETNLAVGEKVSFRLIAPDGVYTVRITDGTTSITRGEVALTGEVIGILDERLKNRVPITGARVDTEEKNSAYEFMGSNSLVYLFVAMLIGAAILVAIERRYKKKVAPE